MDKGLQDLANLSMSEINACPTRWPGQQPTANSFSQMQEKILDENIQTKNLVLFWESQNVRTLWSGGIKQL